MDDSSALFAGLVAGAAVKASALYWIRSQVRRELVGTVAKFGVYPVKSGHELAGVQTASLTRHGLMYQQVFDRHLMVTRADGGHYNLSLNGRLTQVRPLFEDGRLYLTAPGEDKVEVALDEIVKANRVVNVNVRGETIDVLDCGDVIAAWTSRVIQKEGMRLSYCPTTFTKRPGVGVKKAWPTLVQPGDDIAFQDLSQCMIMAESSLDVLNSRLQTPVSSRNFRPNIIVKGTKPFDEDTWRELIIGDSARVRYIDKCPRCMITTLDPDTGARNKEEQPLKELRSFRLEEKYGRLPLLGVHFAIVAEGDVKVGDPVYVIRRSSN